MPEYAEKCACVKRWPEGEVCRRLTLFHNTSSHPWRPNRADSPKWTCEKATGKQENTRVCYTKHHWGRAETKGWASVPLTLLIESWSTGMDLSQHTKALASGSEYVCDTNELSVMDRSKPFRQAGALQRGCYIPKTTLRTFSSGILWSHFPNTSHVRASEHRRLWYKPVRQKSTAWSRGVFG